ncbi:MAG: metallophosphoesterase [Myxococcota bacterium]|nr:metallophosphoesterase [Myxococcota bacterium]
MRIGILSDSHDNIWHLDKAIPMLTTCDAILHCGDLVAPFMILRLVKGVGDIPVHMVWGNNDGDKRLLTEVARDAGSVQIHGDLAELELGGIKIAVNHYPAIGHALAKSSCYDLVCYGHDHTAFEQRVGQTVLLNPGELMGMNGPSTIAVFDTETRIPSFIEI